MIVLLSRNWLIRTAWMQVFLIKWTVHCTYINKHKQCGIFFMPPAPFSSATSFIKTTPIKRTAWTGGISRTIFWSGWSWKVFMTTWCMWVSNIMCGSGNRPYLTNTERTWEQIERYDVQYIFGVSSRAIEVNTIHIFWHAQRQHVWLHAKKTIVVGGSGSFLQKASQHHEFPEPESLSPKPGSSKTSMFQLGLGSRPWCFHHLQCRSAGYS